MNFAKVSVIIVTAIIMASSFYKIDKPSTIPVHVITSFTTWSEKYSKAYDSPAERLYRLSVFFNTYQEVLEHNKSKSTYTKELNQFSDMTNDEFKTKMLGFKFSELPRNEEVDLS
jgi:KDEL-tailed cysteine endopeptidase